MAWKDLSPQERETVRADAIVVICVLTIACVALLGFVAGSWLFARMGL